MSFDLNELEQTEAPNFFFFENKDLMSISENLMVSQLNSTQKRELLSKVDGKVCGTLM